MSKEVETKMESHSLTEFWGGDDRGVCIQVTSLASVDDEGFVSLTMEEAAALCGDLSKFIKREAVRRQSLLREQLAELKIAERTVFNEVIELSDGHMTVAEIAIGMVSAFCPKARCAINDGGL